MRSDARIAIVANKYGGRRWLKDNIGSEALNDAIRYALV